MNYFIKRNDQELGPYSLTELHKMASAGQLQPSDLVRSEGLTHWFPISQVLGTIRLTPPPPPPASPRTGNLSNSYSDQNRMPGQDRFGGAASYAPIDGPMPPSLHWGVVLVLTVVTCWIFGIIWMLVEASFVRKIDKSSPALVLIILHMVSAFGSGVLGATEDPQLVLVAPLLQIGSLVVYLFAIFSMRKSLEIYYNSAEPIGLKLSGVITFFFALYYFQYHFSRIANWKKTGSLDSELQALRIT